MHTLLASLFFLSGPKTRKVQEIPISVAGYFLFVQAKEEPNPQHQTMRRTRLVMSERLSVESTCCFEFLMPRILRSLAACALADLHLTRTQFHKLGVRVTESIALYAACAM